MRIHQGKKEKKKKILDSATSVESPGDAHDRI